MTTIEEKAKAYDEALGWMRELYPTMEGFVKEDAEHYFPELTESDDERIRKELIGYLVHRADLTAFIDEGKDCKRWIAYLEKQKEQKPDDDPLDDPKFTKGFDTGREVQRIFDEQKPAEWSEEDEERIQRIYDFLWKNRKGDTDTIYRIEKDAIWLKSLKPQPHWKPSDKQMRILSWAANGMVDKSIAAPEMRAVLRELYDDLKKLM